MSRNQVRLLFVVLLVFAVFLTGCQRKPDLPTVSRDEIQSVILKKLEAGTSRPATDEEIERFVESYSKAGRYSDDVGTTHPALIEVVLKSGAMLRVWGGAEEFQTVGLNDKEYTQHNVKGSELGHLLKQVATDTISPPLTAAATVSTEGARTGLEERQRFLAVSDLAHGGYAIIDYKSMPSPDWSAELIVYGKVVKVDPARWSTPDGQRPSHDVGSEDFAYKIYTTFYLQPTEIKGSPRFGAPIAIMVPFHDKLLAPGDEVLVFAEYAGERRSGTWKQDAYFSIEGVRGIYMKVGEQYLNIDSGQPCQSP